MMHLRTREGQAGSTLLEALFAILIFSMGILAIIGLQVASIKQSVASKYRSDAGLLANRLIGQMWVSDRTPATLQTNFATGGTNYLAWKSEVAAALPIAAVSPPTVTITPIAGGSFAGGPVATPSSKATIRIFWKAPSDSASEPAHSYTVVTQIK